MTLLQGLKKMRQMVKEGKIVKDPNNLYEDENGNEVLDDKDAKCGCLMGIAYIVAGGDYIHGLDPFLWERDETCTMITKQGPEAMFKAINKQIAKAEKAMQ